MTANSASFNALLKRLWPQDRVERHLYDESPLLGRLKKDTGFVGKTMHIGVVIGGAAGVSANFATAVSRRRGSQSREFVLGHRRDYGVFSIDGLLIEQAANNKGALVRAMDLEPETALIKLKNSMSRGLYGNGGGAIGRIASGGGTATLTLTNPDDIVHFETEEWLQTATTDGTSGTVDVAAAQQIESIDRDAGTITFAAAVPAGFADGNYLFQDGDFGAKIQGLAAWLPATAPTPGDNFNGLDRSVDATKLAGVRFTATPSAHHTLQRAFVAAGARLKREGGTADALYMNTMDFATLLNDVGDKTRFEKVPGKTASGAATLAYDSLVMKLPCGTVNVHDDIYCPRGRAYLLKSSSWGLYTAGQTCGFLKKDGLTLRMETDADAYQGRMGMYGDIGCNAPGHNATIDISAFSNAA